MASAPKRARSLRGEPITEIISIAQQARPKPSGKRAFLRAQFCASSKRVSSTDFSTNSWRAGPSRSPRSISRALQLARAELAGIPDVLTGHFHSRAPLLQTKTKATSRSTTNTIVSTRANDPKACSCTAIG